MWALKFRAREKWSVYSRKTYDANVTVLLYSHKYYESDGNICFVGSGIVQGSTHQRDEFFSLLRADEKVSHLETNQDFFVCTYVEPLTEKRLEAAKAAYNPRLIFLKPAIVDSEGWEEWEVASICREDLEKFISQAESLDTVESELLYLREQPVKNMMVYSMIPELSARQREILLLAVEQGYFGYPRKTDLQSLADQLGISVSTAQFHLAKAEQKVLPFVAKRISDYSDKK